LLVNAACHPVHEMCIPQVSAEFPGEMVRTLDRRHPGCVAMFLNGAAGNLNPPIVSGGADDAREHGQLLAGAVDQALMDPRLVPGSQMAMVRRTVEMPRRDAEGHPSREPLRTQISALRVGDVAFCFLPGEPFIETSMAIRDASPSERTMVVGYAGDWIGYIPTDRAFENGGYETNPGSWYKVRPGSERIYRRSAIDVVRKLFDGD
jgi:hypothetical protein